MTATESSLALLTAADPAAATVLAPKISASRCLLVADHASNRVPNALDNLGCEPRVLDTHLGWDIGTRALTEALSDRLGFGAVIQNYSRLVVDCNRAVEDESAFLTYSDGVRVPGNQGLDTKARRARLKAIYFPYHKRIDGELQKLEVSGCDRAALVSIHSFTPIFDGIKRRWDCGVLWDKDPRIAVPLIAALRAAGHCVGDNEPYSGRSSADYTVDYHGESQGRAHVAIEVRQDYLSDANGIASWADQLADILERILSDEAVYTHLREAG